MRNKLIVADKEKDFIDYLKDKHISLTLNIGKLNDEKSDIESKLIENLICPECYSMLIQSKYLDYGYYECTVCDYMCQQ